MKHSQNGEAPWEDGADAKTVNSALHDTELNLADATSHRRLARTASGKGGES